MAVSFEQAEKNLAQLIDWFTANASGPSRNEATTRLHLINELIFPCLGWDKGDCVAEESLQNTYTDYSLGVPQRQLIVEAKKEGVYFELPIGNKNRLLPIQHFVRHAPEIGSAISQALGYAQTRGVPYAAVSNGHQLLAFIASRNDGVPPLDGLALVFDSLEAMQQDFLLLWQCLSKDGLPTNRLWTQLRTQSLTPPPRKLSASIPGYPGYWRRNALQTDLQILVDLFIEDIADLESLGDEREFLTKCYASSGALSQYATVSREILRSRYAALFGEVNSAPSLDPATNKKGVNPALLAQALSRRPILLIGDRGVGKTTFIKNLYQVAAEDVFKNAVILYIDFGSKPSLLADLQQFVFDEMSNQLYQKYQVDVLAGDFVRAVLHLELQRFDRGIYGELKNTNPELYRQRRLDFIEQSIRNRDEYLHQSLEHIAKGRRQQIVIFLDNVDQRTDEFQEQVFLIGQTMAANWPVAVFVSLRPETFRRSRLAGTLSAYQARAFTLSPPRVDDVVVKRLQYGISLLDKGLQIGIGSGISAKVETLKDYLEVLVFSFKTNRHLMEFLDNMCGGNIRLALEFVKTFISSGHVDTEKILRIYRDSGSYMIPLHEFMRAVTFGDHEHYFPDASEIINLFDISTPDQREHFLKLLILAFLDRDSQEVGGYGFIEAQTLYSWTQSLGFNPDQIGKALDQLTLRKLVEGSTDFRPPAAGLEHHYRITSVGGYYVRRLVARFAYIDAMVVDTPIVDPKVQGEIIDVSQIGDRLNRANVFLEYLSNCWKVLPSTPMPLDWSRIRNMLGRDIDYVLGRIAIREDVPQEESRTVVR